VRPESLVSEVNYELFFPMRADMLLNYQVWDETVFSLRIQVLSLFFSQLILLIRLFFYFEWFGEGESPCGYVSRGLVFCRKGRCG